MMTVEVGTKSDIERELLALASQNGGELTPEVVVDFAKKNKNSALYTSFDWDDKSAAHTARLDHARRLIRSVKVIITTETQRVRAVGFVRDPRKDVKDQGYVTTARMRTEKDLNEAAMAQELDRLESLMARVFKLAAALGREDDVVEFMMQKMNEARKNAA